MSKSVTKSVSKSVPHAMPAGGIMMIPLGRIKVDPEFNVRQTADEEKIKELAKSIEAEGQIQDVIVEPMEDGNYFLIGGHRRLAAFKLLLESAPDSRKKTYENIRGSLWVPTDAKGQRLTDKKEIEIARYFVNMAENVQRSNVTTYDLAQRIAHMKKTYELDGGEIGKRLGKGTSYTNNLLAIMGMGEKGKNAGNTLHPRILARWKEECSWSEDDNRTRICKTNVLRSWVSLSHDTQLSRFDRELWIAENPGEDPAKYDAQVGGQNGTSAAGAGAGNNADDGAVRATKKELIAALEAAERAKKGAEGEKLTRINGVIDGLKFCLGVKKGLTNRIKDVCAFKDGDMIEGAPPKETAESAN